MRLNEIAGYAIPLGLVVYLGFSEGGVEPIVHEEVGIACAWVLLMALAAGFLRRWRPPAVAMAAAGTLAALATWTLLALLWSESPGNTAVELARVSTYVGVFVLGLVLQGPGGARRTLQGVAAGVSVLALAALLSRLQPSWFGPNELAEALPDVRSRLAYPLGYWNALGGLVAIGLPLVLWVATSARIGWQRLVAAAIAPALVLVIYLTLSRGGALAALVGLAIFAALYPIRIAIVPVFATTALAGGLLIWAASSRTALADGLKTSAAERQGDELIVLVLAAAALVAFGHWLLLRAIESGRLPKPQRVPRRWAVASSAVCAALLIVTAIGVGVPGQIDERFEEFRQSEGVADDSSRLTSASSNGRWQYWKVAAGAGADNPVLGIGPGSYEYWWAREGELSGVVKDAHSLYVEAFAESGVVGVILLLGLSGLVVGAGVSRSLRASTARRAMLAAATAGAGAFIVIAAVDWVWEFPVVVVAFLLIGAAILGSRSGERESAEKSGSPGGSGMRLVIGAGAVLVIAAIALPYLSLKWLERSEAEFRAGDYRAALADADRARDVQPFAAAPRRQRVFALEASGRLDAAAAAAMEAVERERTNWQNYFILARIQLLRDRRESALEAYERARRLNPKSPLLQRPPREGQTGPAPP